MSATAVDRCLSVMEALIDESGGVTLVDLAARLEMPNSAIHRTLATLASETRIERIRIAANLRHDKLDAEVNEATLEAGLPASVPFAAELTFLHGLAQEDLRAEEMDACDPDFQLIVSLRAEG